METVEVVIKLSKFIYNNVMNYSLCGNLASAVREGTVLPQEHGRLIDADSMKRIDAIQRGDFNSIESIRAWIDIMSTVVEADKESEG